MNIQVCRDTSDAVALFLPQRLYLKSFAKLNISVQLPSHKVHNKSISNWELMEKFRKMIQPDSFSILKVSKHSSEVIRFDAELENRSKLERVILRLDDRVLQLNDYPDPLKIRISEAKSDFPSRHSWDSFFRDSTDMDEMKPGERPDTIHIENLPIRWFVHEKDRDEDAPPSETIFRKAFEKFGSIRQVDIPAADPFRMQMKTAMRGMTTPPQEAALYFDGYVQFNEYVGFVRCMDALRGRKLLRKREDIAEWCGIRVDFDKTKHMTDAAVKRRAIVRERLLARHNSKEEEEKEKEKINKRQAKERLKAEKAEQEKMQKMREREERRKKKQLAKLMKSGDVNVSGKVAEEHRKLLKSQKTLQAIRLLEELFMRIELRPELQRNGKAQHYHASMQRMERAQFVENFKRKQENLVESMRQQLNNAVDGRVVIRNALETKKHTMPSSISSISSDEEAVSKRVKTERLTTPEREMDFNKATGMYGIPPYGFGYPFPAVPPGYPFPPQTSMYYPVRGAYYPAEGPAARGARGRGRARGRGCRLPYFEGPDASHQYYLYFKKLTEAENRNEHDDRTRSRSRTRRRSYSRSRSRSRRRSYTRSRSRSRSRRSRSRRTRSRSRRSRSRSRRSRSHHSRSKSKSRKRSKSRSRRSRTRSRSKSRHHTPSPKQQDNRSERNERTSEDNKTDSPSKARTRERSKSWSLPKDGERKSWSKSPKEK
ncbi:LOW QUALITY PROTEIN: A-kinase anchor protein 17A [Aphomia sociella]